MNNNTKNTFKANFAFELLLSKTCKHVKKIVNFIKKKEKNMQKLQNFAHKTKLQN